MVLVSRHFGGWMRRHPGFCGPLARLQRLVQRLGSAVSFSCPILFSFSFNAAPTRRQDVRLIWLANPLFSHGYSPSARQDATVAQIELALAKKIDRYIHAYIHAYIHTYTHTLHTYTHTYIYASTLGLALVLEIRRHGGDRIAATVSLHESCRPFAHPDLILLGRRGNNDLRLFSAIRCATLGGWPTEHTVIINLPAEA